jgi:hypothetical protein
MQRALLSATAAVVAASLSAQNEVLYYKFEGGGTKALNYAASSPAPGEGPITNTLTTAPTTSFVPGPYGDALTSGVAQTPYQANWVDTGWAPNVTGDYSWAMWMRNSRGNPGPSLTYVAGIPVSGQFRIYSGSSILLTVGGAGGTTYYSTNANVFQLATAGWVHVAFVVDTTAMTATYYINGVPEAPDPLTALPNIVGSTFYIGRQTTANAPSVYDIDEFRFLTRAATAAEVQVWATQNGAGASAFGAGCGGTLTAQNGPPTIGNLTFGMQGTSSAPSSVGVLALGLSRTQWGALPLPLDLGLALGAPLAGCQLECSPDVTLTVITDPAGAFQQPFPLLPDPALDGFALYAQTLLLGGPTGLATTNPLAIVLGN